MLSATATTKKPYFKRSIADRTQRFRQIIQFSFLILNIWLGVQFYYFVRQYEQYAPTGVSRPPGVEGWLPIAGLMNLKAFLLTGNLPEVHPAAMVLVSVFLLSSWLLRKAFCGWLCPVGTISEYLWKLGRKIFRRTYVIPKWADIPLRGLKYLLMSFFLYAVLTMPVNGILNFLESPYGLVADVKMLLFFRTMGETAAIVLLVIILSSLIVKNFWCRYLCPYGALMGLASLASPVWIKRNESRCIDCDKCNKACPSSLPVAQLIQIRSAECLGCLECVAVCPAEDALDLTIVGRKRLFLQQRRPWAIGAALALLFFGFVGMAKVTGHWHTPIPDDVYQRLIPHAGEFGHPH